jgi:hypothetical protein
MDLLVTSISSTWTSAQLLIAPQFWNLGMFVHLLHCVQYQVPPHFQTLFSRFHLEHGMCDGLTEAKMKNTGLVTTDRSSHLLPCLFARVIPERTDLRPLA